MLYNRYNRAPDKPRIVISGIGMYGSIVARIAHDIGYEIVGAYNRAGPKIGKDLGELIGLDRELGVKVEDIETADLSSTRAHVGVSCQSNDLRRDFTTYRRFIEAGMNVVSLATEAYHPWDSDPETAAEIDALARRHSVTFTGTGIRDMSRVWSGIIAAGQCMSIRHIYHESMTNGVEQAASPTHLIRDFAMSKTVEEYWSMGFDKHRLWPVYTYMLKDVLEVLGYTVTDMQTRIEPVVWDRDLESPYLNMVVPAGRVLGTRTVGSVTTREGVTAEVRAEGRLCAADEQDYTLWRVDGDPGVEMFMKRGDPGFTNGAALVNRIKDVIAAPPGIVTISQLGPMMGPELLAKLQH